MATAFLVLDLGFGDSGKGTTVDFLCRERSVDWIVRFNGGGQAGHNVVLPDGRHHTFSQFGAGSFLPSIRTYLGPDVVVHPGALLVEAEILSGKSVASPLARLALSPACLITTPFHQSLGRLRELARGAAAHGTCGVGVGETVRDSLSAGASSLRAHHLASSAAHLRDRVHTIRDRLLPHALALLQKCPSSEPVALESALFSQAQVVDRWLTQIEPLREAIRAGLLRLDDGSIAHRIASGNQDIVFEGAQGILLDEDCGFHPHTTWSRCTDHNARAWLNTHSFQGSIHRIGVLRTYMTRHGQGPLPSEQRALGAELPEPHNSGDGWQGAFRRGSPDPLLWRYAIRANGGVDSLALTHADALAESFRLVSAYTSRDSTLLDASGELRAMPRADLSARERQTKALAQVKVEFATPPTDIADAISGALDTPISILSSGPRYDDKVQMSPFLTRASG